MAKATLEIPNLDGNPNAIKWRLKLVSKRLGENLGITKDFIQKLTRGTEKPEDILALASFKLLMPNEVDWAVLMATSALENLEQLSGESIVILSEIGSFFEGKRSKSLKDFSFKNPNFVTQMRDVLTLDRDDLLIRLLPPIRVN